MLVFIFTILMFLIFGKIFIFTLKAAWGLLSIFLSVVLLPLILIGLVLYGLLNLALPLLIIIGIIFLFTSKD